MSVPVDDADPAADLTLLEAIGPEVDRLLERHLATAKEWFPHEYVPWSRGRDFEPDEVWDPTAGPADPGVASALFVNLLTEDNLPHYFHTIASHFRTSDAWQAWTRRWTAEEGRHSIVIRDYVTVARLVDPIALERARMAQVPRGEVPNPAQHRRGMVYVTLQELGDRVAHRNTGKRLEDPAGADVMSRVANDENLHYLFYRDLATAALAADPSRLVRAIEAEVVGFAMPGTGIPGFELHARAIAAAGIYDFGVHHEHVLVPVVLHHWRLADLTGLDAEAEQARERTLAFIERLGRVAQRDADRRARRTTRAGRRPAPAPPEDAPTPA